MEAATTWFPNLWAFYADLPPITQFFLTASLLGPTNGDGLMVLFYGVPPAPPPPRSTQSLRS
jgi:hypothetical protein